MSNRTYDKLKYLAQVILPAAATAYATIATVCGLPYATQVTGVIAAVDTLLGSVLGISSKQYSDDLQKLIDETDNNIDEKGEQK